MKRVTPIVGALLVLAFGLASPHAAALTDDDSPDAERTRVEQASAKVEAGSVVVSGRATFVDTPVTVGVDDGSVAPAGPSGPGIGDTTGIGDLTAATIARPDPFGSELNFAMDVATGDVPPIAYRWAVPEPSNGFIRCVDSTMPVGYELEAGQRANAPGEVVFRILRGHIQSAQLGVIGAKSCGFGYYLSPDDSIVAEVDGSIGDGRVEWRLPMDLIGRSPGDVIVYEGTLAKGPIVQTVDGFVDAPPLLGALDELFGSTMAAYEIPRPVVRFGIAPVGAQDIGLEHEALVEAPGTFHSTVPAPSMPGDYSLIVESCYGSGNCDRATTTFTVPA